MKPLVKIVIPDAGPINTLAAANLLYLLLKPKNVRIVLIRTVHDEVISRTKELATFMESNKDRIEIVTTSICKDILEKKRRCEPIEKGRGDLAIADFLLHFVDDVVGNSPALLVYEDKKLARLRLNDEIGENVHFITTAAYLRKLELEGIIASFEETWTRIVNANAHPDPSIDRSPNPKEAEYEADGGNAIFPKRSREESDGVVCKKCKSVPCICGGGGNTTRPRKRGIGGLAR